MNVLELHGIEKTYGDVRVLDDVNLEVREGETLGIIGPTGAGKSTLLRIINLLERPDSGEIIFQGENVAEKRDVDVRRRMGMVFQNTPVFRGTIRESILYGPHLRGMKPEDREVREILELVGLEDASRKTNELSGGERQRLALAQVLINRPELVLLDEATSSLDPVSTRRMEEVISELDVTVILTTHDLIQGQKLSDRIAILNRRILQVGEPAEVFRRPASRFVAEFVGAENILRGRARVTPDGVTIIECDGVSIYSSEEAEGVVSATVRPEDITVSWGRVESSALNQLRGTVKAIRDSGTLQELEVRCGGETLTVHMTARSLHDMGITTGSEVWLEFKASAVHVIR
ncbi:MULTISPECIES: ABC transporter ATP-binding protein [unclassified Methanothermobacter]|uniref:ABC transporter ATP-binding protein n=1 Tax=unclassified Methanothermobacter TaxID=2631116 RepID=UPI0011C848F1|nr:MULTISPECIES: ABC transporter ATP-binding protein [unclassified Methanothermobacter]QEF95290.1 ABC transporter ATP-binding protein [Methanothermobacter sp. KEPCO-1]QHN08058.1 ABC transporter ATP-binding protein [Methanothermobacter sp. THM-2]